MSCCSLHFSLLISISFLSLSDQALLNKEGNGHGVTKIKPTGILGVWGRDTSFASPDDHLAKISSHGWDTCTRTLLNAVCMWDLKYVRFSPHGFSHTCLSLPTVHCGSIRQTATILSMTRDCLRTGDKATVHFRFIKTPEYLHIDQRLVFREGRTKAVGTITKVSFMRQSNIWKCCSIFKDRII